MSLRIATPDDLEQIGSLLWKMTGEIGIGRVNEPKAREAVTRVVKDNSCILSMRRDEIAGILGLTVTSWWYSSDRFITDLFFFVHPDHRKIEHDGPENINHASQMVAWAKAAADKMKIPLVLSVGTCVDPLPKVRFLRSKLEPFGGSFIHKPRAA